MSHRPHAYTLVKVPTHAGNPPNTYVPEITAEIRLYWTPTTDRQLLLAALDQAYLRIKDEIDAKPETYGRKVLEVGVDIDSVGIPIRRCAVCGNPGSNATREGELRHMDAYGHAPLFGGGAQ